MISLVIIAIGMLGIAKMQGLAISSTNASRSRALAAIEASSLAAAMQANRAFWSATATAPATVTINGTPGAVPTMTPAGPLQTAWNAASAAGVACPTTLGKLSCYCTSGNSCTSTTLPYGMAANDLYDFAQGLATFLPTYTATITCNTADVPLDCTIKIQWTENTVALDSQEAAVQAAAVTAGTLVPVTYSLYVVP